MKLNTLFCDNLLYKKAFTDEDSISQAMVQD